MTTATISNKAFRFFAAAALAATILAGTVSTGHALPGTPEQRKACTPDVLSLCGSEIPNVTKVVACMKRKQDQISSTCKAALGI